jgi:hypothetical protein
VTRSQRKRLRKFRRLVLKSKKRLKVPRGFSRHHRKPRSLGGGDENENISVVTLLQHQSFHNLFSNLTPPVIAQILNQKWIDPEYEFVCVKRKR